MVKHSTRFTIDDTTVHLPHDVEMHLIVMVNVFFVGDPDADRPSWVLVDAGLPGSAGRIAALAKARFGDVPPRAIVLTHGHFDHVGGLPALLELWPDVPVFAHAMELPYLDGTSSYPPPDPSVGGGLMARLSPTFPTGPYNFGERVQHLPDDGTVPGMTGWRWVPTPGHSPGHVSFFRESDGTLIVGDAFITQRQESLLGVITRKRVLRGPPTYFTPDWERARDSVRRLAALRPQLALTGHGLPMANPRLARDLDALAEHFDETARPAGGRYSEEPAVTDESGVVALPPKPSDPTQAALIVAGITAAGVGAFLLWNRSQREPEVRTVAQALRRHALRAVAPSFVKPFI